MQLPVCEDRWRAYLRISGGWLIAGYLLFTLGAPILERAPAEVVPWLLPTAAGLCLGGLCWFHYRIAQRLLPKESRRRAFLVVFTASFLLLLFRVFAFAIDLKPGCYGAYSDHPPPFNYACFFCWSSLFAWELYFLFRTYCINSNRSTLSHYNK